MKKISAIFLTVILVFTICACGKTEGDRTSDVSGQSNPSASLQATESVSNNAQGDAVPVTNPNVNLDITQEGVKAYFDTYFSVVDIKSLGMSGESIDDYTIAISPVDYKGVASAKVEMTPVGGSAVEKIFVFSGTSVFMYDEANAAYLFLSPKGPVALVESDEPVTDEDDVLQDENSKAITADLSKYDVTPLGLPKDISAYKYETTMDLASSEDGKKLCVIKIFDGEAETDYKIALAISGDVQYYYFDSATDAYKPFALK